MRKALILFISVIIFSFINISVVFAEPECEITNNSSCGNCEPGLNRQYCTGGTMVDYDDPYNTTPPIGESCNAYRSCQISEVSCDCTVNGNPPTACQGGSTCSGVNSDGVCHHCITPTRECNSDPTCGPGCTAPPNTCGANNGTHPSCVYTKFNGEEGCTYTPIYNTLPCTKNNCAAGQSCNANGACETPVGECIPGGFKGSYCDTTGGSCNGRIVEVYYKSDCSDEYRCTSTSCSPNVCNINGIQDGTETGTDCGGPDCPSCIEDPPPCSNSGPVCGANFTMTGIDIRSGNQRTVNSITYANTSNGNNIPSSNSITIKPGDVLQFNSKPTSALQSDSCVISYNGRYDIVRKLPGPETTINRCFEGLLFGEALFCENGQGKIGYRLQPVNSNFNPDGIPSIPPLTIERTIRGCGWHHRNDNPDGTYFHQFMCSACTDDGKVGPASGGPTDNNFEKNSGYDANGNVQYTPENWGSNFRFQHGTSEPNPDDLIGSQGDVCLIQPDNFPTSPQNPGLSPEQAARDNMTKKQFDTPGEYRVEYRTQRSGPNGGAMSNNPCVMKVIVENPEPPSGTISANPTTCVIQDGQYTCSSTISWDSSDADTIRIVLREDGAVFAPAGTPVDGSQAATWINATPITFDLFGSSYSFPNEALLASITVRGNPYINGDVFIDINENGIRDAGENTYTSGGNIFINGTPTALDGNGHYARTNIIPSSYEVAFTAPTGYQLTTASPRSISLTQPTTVNFGIAPLHTVSGRIFNDRNKNRVYDTGDSLYTDNVTISGTTNGSPVETTTNGGNYTLSNIPTGLRTISLTSPLPSGYRIIWPRATTPPSYSVQVGPSCASGPLDTTTGASYTNQTECDIQNLDFAVSDSVPWIQMIGSDGRFDGGLSNSVANNLACNGGYTLIPGNNSAPGVLLIGPSSPSTSFGGIGAASATNWVIGSPFPEYFTFFGSNPDAQAAGIQTSYDYLLGAAQTSNITPTNLTTLCSDLSNCTLNNPPNGIYQANGDVTLTGNSTMSANRDYIFLINGNLTINGRITTPVSSTTTFSAKGDITVTQTVGVSAFACPSPLTNGQIQGFFSADESIIIDAKDSTGQGANCSNGDGEDLQLNVDGALVANAALGGGSFINRRDLCSFNTTYPSLTVKERLDFVLNAPELLKTNTYIYREVAP